MIRRLNFSRLFAPLAFIWTLYCLFIYFFSINPVQSGTCKLSNECFSIQNSHWQITANQSHQYYTDAFLESIGIGPSQTHTPGPILLILFGLLFLYTANLFYDRFIEKKKQLNFSFTPFSILIIITVIFFLIYNRWTAFFGLDTPIRYQGIFIKYPLFMAELLAMILLPLTIGRKLLNFIFREEVSENSKLRQFLLSLGFGLMLIIFTLYFLGLLKILVLKYILIIFGSMLLLSIKSLIYWFGLFFRYKISFRAKYFEASVFLAILLLLAVAQNILDLIRPLPIGFDDLNVYINNPHIMAQKGILISGAMSYYWELYTSLGFIIFKNVTSAMMISFISGIGSLLAILYLVLTYCKKREFDSKTSCFYAFLIAALFLTLPAVVFHTAKDIKVDLAGLFFSLLSLAVFWQWRDKYLAGRNKTSVYLYTAAFLAGFAVAIKYTNLIFVSALFIYLILIIWNKKKVTACGVIASVASEAIYQRLPRADKHIGSRNDDTVSGYKTFSLKKEFILLILFILFTILPVLPISVRNIVQTGSFSAADIRFGKRISQEIKLNPPFDQNKGVIDNFNTYMVQEASGGYEEAGRYLGYEKGLKKYLLLPFRITKNVFSSSLYVDIGFLFLILVPVSLYAFLKIRKQPEVKIFSEVLIIGSVYWLLWTFSSSGIIWYGFSGFIFLFFALIEAHYYFRNQKNRFLSGFINFIIIVWFICAIFLRMVNLPKYNIGLDLGGIRYARGESTPEDNLLQKFGYAKVIEIINKDIAENSANPPKVYRVGTFYKYLIARNDETVIDDQMLDLFAYYYQDQNDNKLIERFKNAGIRYMIIDRGMRNVDKTPERSYIKKYDQFEALIRKNASVNFGIMSDSSDEKIFILRIY